MCSQKIIFQKNDDNMNPTQGANVDSIQEKDSLNMQEKRAEHTQEKNSSDIQKEEPTNKQKNKPNKIQEEKPIKMQEEKSQKQPIQEDAQDSPKQSHTKEESKLDPRLFDLIDYYEEIKIFDQKAAKSPIHVDELASKFAGLYEQVRRVIDWKEEHLIRRTAIDRALKRRMLSKLSGISLVSDLSGKRIAEPLILELIRGGYFPNDSISKQKIPEVQKVLDKYIFILSHSSVLKKISPLAIKKKVEFYNWILEIAACEIEEVLDPPLQVQGLVNFMTNIMTARITISPQESITDQKKITQTYIAVQRALFNLDDPIVTYNLIKFRNPSWLNHPPKVIREFTEDLMNIWNNLNEDLRDKAGKEIYKVCMRYDAVYRIIGDVLEKLNNDPSRNSKEIFEKWEDLKKVVKKSYKKRVSTLKSRLFRSALFSTLSIFLAGGLSLFIFEVPLAKLFLGEFRPLAIAVDMLIPTVLMFVLVASIRPAGKKNYKRLLDEVKKVVYEDIPLDVYSVELKKRKRVFRNLFFGLVYLLTSALSFGFVFWIFKIAKVPWTSLYIDTANVAVVVFAALVIKQKAKEVTVKENVGFADFIVEIFSIPLARLGQWLASKWKEYNFLSVFFTVAIDIPVLTVVEIIEDWRNFLKDKKAGIH
jgi:hypothetical protein